MPRHFAMGDETYRLLSSSLFCMSPKDSTGKPLYNLLNQIQISHEVERAITSGLKQLSRGAKGVQCETTPGEQTRWQHKTLPMPRKILQTLLML